MAHFPRQEGPKLKRYWFEEGPFLLRQEVSKDEGGRYVPREANKEAFEFVDQGPQRRKQTEPNRRFQINAEVEHFPQFKLDGYRHWNEQRLSKQKKQKIFVNARDIWWILEGPEDWEERNRLQLNSIKVFCSAAAVGGCLDEYVNWLLRCKCRNEQRVVQS